MWCTNNLKQIGLALHNYHDEKQAFPPQRERVSIRITLLPYLEQPAKYDLCMDSAHGVWENYEEWTKPVPYYCCPSDGEKNLSFRNDYTSNYPTAAYNYSFFSGDRCYNSYVIQPRGVFPTTYTAAADFASITDGTSNTMGVSEQVRPSGQGGFGEAGIVGSYYKPTDILPKFDKTTGQFVSGTTYYSAPLGWRWSDGLFMYSGMAAGLPPNQASYGNQSSAGGGFWQITPASHHSGGVNVCFMDGSIHFISETIDCGNLGANYPNHTTATTNTPSGNQGISSMEESPYGVWGALSTKTSGESKTL